MLTAYIYNWKDVNPSLLYPQFSHAPLTLLWAHRIYCLFEITRVLYFSASKIEKGKGELRKPGT